MSTLLSYLAAVGRPDGAARLVWAGHEPQQFINLFPEWSQREDVRLFNAKVSRGEKQGGGGAAILHNVCNALLWFQIP